eukprot:951544-Alexandrium_andersonii.AAC.1
MCMCGASSCACSALSRGRVGRLPRHSAGRCSDSPSCDWAAAAEHNTCTARPTDRHSEHLPFRCEPPSLAALVAP